MVRPTDHPLRGTLNAEAHARPPEPLRAPLRMTYLALFGDAAQRAGEQAHIATLAATHGARAPADGANHYSAEFGAFRLVWERHTEFSRYLFVVDDDGAEPFAQPAIAAVPTSWLQGLVGQTLVATHVALLHADESPPDLESIAANCFEGNTLLGATIAHGSAVALTDFRIHADGFGRLLVLNRAMPSRQAGRMVQRLLEIDTYRILALLAFPIAREMNPVLASREQELAEITAQMAGTGEVDEVVLLDRLTRLEAGIESREASSNFRFTAAAAYYDLVRARIVELREQRLPGLQNFQEFTDRRLAPAMNTCRSVSSRLESLSERTARVTNLLATRVGVSRERQNQELLASMNKRAAAQLRLQQTVEGLSIAAITYYIVGLVGYAAKGLEAAGAPIDPGVATAVSIPFVLALAAWGIRRIRKAVVHSVG
jgi:uncharacterized membrane-anchored protein